MNKMNKNTLKIQSLIIGVYVLTFCMCTTIGTCAAIPEYTTRVLTIIIVLLEIGYIVSKKTVRISITQKAWILFAWVVFVSIVIKANPLSLIALNLLAGFLFLITPLYEFDSFEFSISFLMIFGLISAIGVYLQFLHISIWNPIYHFLTTRSQNSNADLLQHNILYSGYGYLSGFCYNAGFTATYLVNGIIATMLSKYKLKWKAFIIAFLAIALVLTGKRGQVFALIMALIIAYPLSSVSITKKAKRILLISCIIILTYFIGYVIYKRYSEVISNNIKRILGYIYGGAVSSSGREYYAEQSVLLFKANPVLGVGWRNLASLIGNEPHNSYVQIMTETGFLGLAIVIIALVFSLYHTIRSFNRISKVFTEDKEVRSFYYSIISFEVYFIILSYVENTFCNIEFYYMMFLVISMEIAFYKSKSDFTRRPLLEGCDEYNRDSYII